MRRILLLLTLLSSLSFATGTIPAEEFRSRRAALRKNLDGTVVLFGRSEGADEVYGFIQEPNFYYLTGWTEPGAVLIVTPAKEMLFLPHHNKRRELYTGKRGSAEDRDIHSLTGFDEVLPIEKFESSLGAALDSYENVYALTNELSAEKLKDRYPFRAFSSAFPLVAKLRMVKSSAELAAIQHSTDVTLEAHRAAWKKASPGLYEYQLAATVGFVYTDHGCQRQAYAAIVGSGPNGAILHYSANSRRMDQGEMVVMDTAAQCAEYASDITRTIPVSGKFSKRQRELYDIVLGAQNAVIAAVKPGVDPRDLTKIAREYMDSHGKDMHGEKLGKYFTHGVGHSVGLDVHDAQVPGPLEAGMVFTVEPGVYIPEESIGIRIEDVVLVTENGAKLLSAALPREPDQIEKAMAK